MVKPEAGPPGRGGLPGAGTHWPQAQARAQAALMPLIQVLSRSESGRKAKALLRSKVSAYTRQPRPKAVPTSPSLIFHLRHPAGPSKVT